MQNSRVFHRSGAGDHLRYLRDFRRDKDRHVREEQPDKIIAFGFVLPELVPIDFT